jgi:hypothetical protein
LLFAGRSLSCQAKSKYCECILKFRHCRRSTVTRAGLTWPRTTWLASNYDQTLESCLAPASDQPASCAAIASIVLHDKIIPRLLSTQRIVHPNPLFPSVGRICSEAEYFASMATSPSHPLNCATEKSPTADKPITSLRPGAFRRASVGRSVLPRSFFDGHCSIRPRMPSFRHSYYRYPIKETRRHGCLGALHRTARSYLARTRGFRHGSLRRNAYRANVELILDHFKAVLL